jgi:hypothetical protein
MGRLLAGVVIISHLGLIGTTSLAIEQAGGHGWQIAFMLPAVVSTSALAGWMRRQFRRV